MRMSRRSSWQDLTTPSSDLVRYVTPPGFSQRSDLPNQ
jgi:hypothetical protein